MKTIFTDVRYQPRWVFEPDNPRYSEWHLAIFEPDEDEHTFRTIEEAQDAGNEWYQQELAEMQVEKFNGSLVIAKITTEYMYDQKRPIEYGPDEIVINDDNGDEIVKWTETEWTEDPGVVLAIANAVEIRYRDGAEKLKEIVAIRRLG